MLERIKSGEEIKEMTFEELHGLAGEIREFLLDKTSRTGGHIASNLGVVELTLALHRVFHLPEDKIIWDVGHQSYTHKMLTGRMDRFDTLRKYGGMSGFPKRKESPCDAFDTGHSSTSISAGLGYVKARDLRGEDYSVVSVIGDGSLTGGMAYEALNNAAQLETNFIVVLNDNDMSISKNVGGMSRYLDSLRTADFYTGLKKGVTNTLEKVPVVGESAILHIRKTKSSIKQLLVPGMFFEDMGITYLGPIPGHNIKMLCRALKEAKRIDGPVLVHVMTKKGKGFAPAEQAPDKFHGVGPFDRETGEPVAKKTKDSYTDVFGKVLCDEAKRNENVVAVTAAMADGTGLSRFSRMFPERFFDVGIAEGHAVTFAAGLAAGGARPVFAVYSSFLQRGYDQIVHDVALQKLPVMLAVDRAGLVGSDGETHQGILDLSYLGSIPGMIVLSPKNKWEMADMVRFALNYDGPIALRYPRGSVYEGYREFRSEIELGKGETIFEESGIAIVSIGHIFEEAAKCYEMLKEKGYSCSLVNARFLKPLDEERILSLCENHKLIVTLEENVLSGGFSERVEHCLMSHGISSVRVLACGIEDHFVEHGSIPELRRANRIDADSVMERIVEVYKELAS